MLRHDYKPYSFFESNDPFDYGIIILNYSLASLRNLLSREVWQKAVIRGCADGGSNMLKTYSDENNETLVPDYISGDFDSIEPKTSDYYRAISTVDFIETHDQNATDFTKCVRVMMDRKPTLNNLLVFCSLGGRFDHTTGIIHSLYILNANYPDLQIYLLTDCDITFLLHAQRLNRIHIQSRYNGTYCSLLPFGQLAHVQTEGLKWNLNPTQELSFTKLVSSSNSYQSVNTAYVDVHTDNDIIWTMTYARDKSSL
jgi:thiamine pyrophosphokinase